MRVIRAFAREDYETGRYRSVNDELLDKNLTTVRVFSNNFPFVFLFANLGTLAIIWFGGWQVIGGRLSIGDLVALNTLLGFMLFPILTIGFSLGEHLARGPPRSGSSTCSTPHSTSDAPDASPPTPLLPGGVRRRGVPLLWQHREVLSGISLCGQAGPRRAILGTHGLGQIHARQPHPTLLRRDAGPSGSTATTCAT